MNGLEVWDGFNRSDTTAGNLGVSDSGTTWSIREGSANIRISGGRTKGAIGTTSYFYTTLSRSVTRMGGTILFGTGNGGSVGNGSFGFATGPGNLYSGDDALISNIIHCVISRQLMRIQVRGTRVTGTNFVTIGEFFFPTNLSNALVPYRVELVISGSRAILSVGGYKLEVFDQRIEALNGNKPYWEHFYSTSTGDEELFFEDAWASTGPQIPELPGPGQGNRDGTPSSGVMFPNSTSYASANLTGLTAPNSQSLTVYAKLVIPRKPLDGNTGYIWALNASSTGGTTFPRMFGYLHANDTFLWQFQDTNGSLSWQANGFTDRFGGQTIDVAWVFDKDAGTFKAFVDGSEVPGFGGSTGTPPSVASFTASNTFLTVGNHGPSSPFSGAVKMIGLANWAMSREDLLLAHQNVDQYRWQWATNATLTAGTMTGGKVYRLVAVGTANYFYTNCAVGDRVLFVGGTTAILLSTTNSADGRTPGQTLTMLSSTFTATNTGRQEGFMCLLDGSLGLSNRLVDLSTNLCDAIGANGLSHSLPVPRARVQVPSMTKAQRNAILTPDNGTIVRVTDGTDRLSWYVAGAWVTPTVAADP